MRKIQILDTTLRDGEQAFGMALTPKEKARAAGILDALGVDIVELGFPASSRRDYLGVELASAELKNSVACVFSRVNENDIEIARNSLRKAKKTMLHLSTPVDDEAVFDRLKTDFKGLLSRIYKMIDNAKKQFDAVEIGIENAFTADWGLLEDFCIACCEAGVDVVNIADTSGCANPELVYKVVDKLCKNVSAIRHGATKLGIHCHDDRGLALANTINAIEAGASHAEVCMLGCGERAGNTSLEELAVYIKDSGIIKSEMKYELMGHALRRVSVITGMPFCLNGAVKGINAFSHASGMHQKEIIMGREYGCVKPEEFGIMPGDLLIGRHSGKAGIEEKIKRLTGKTPDKKQTEELAAYIKENCERSFGERDILSLLYEKGIYCGKVPEKACVSVLRKKGCSYIEAVAGNLKSSCRSDNVINGIFFCLDEIYGAGINVKYYSSGISGDGMESKTFFFIEADCDGEKYRSCAFDEDLYAAAAGAYADIAAMVFAAKERNADENNNKKSQ